ncbi:MAG TPA: DNA-formamidopyrimidine glycosylase family protein [Gemmatimonadales bacterium]|jgi:formamidopyrimidine-DNA glycosylase
MPELPDITLYLEQLAPRILHQPLLRIVLKSPFVLRSVDPPLTAVEGKRLIGQRRLGKRIVFELEGELFVVIHLMIAGRFRWRPPGAKAGGRLVLAAFEFPNGSLHLTEAGTKRRASIHLVAREEGLHQFDRGGLEVLEIDLPSFADRLTAENHTLKRALTDPRLFSGIGNAYSDEILHRARLSPLVHTGRLSEAEIATLYQATRATLQHWIQRLSQDAGDAFPERVTAFREGMAVHGRYGKPCPDCGAPVQRIRYADNETNYCARCQTGGRLLADRAMSRLLKQDWPRSIDEVE